MIKFNAGRLADIKISNVDESSEMWRRVNDISGKTPGNPQRAQPHPTLSMLTMLLSPQTRSRPTPSPSRKLLALLLPWQPRGPVHAHSLLQSLERQKSKSSGSDGIPP